MSSSILADGRIRKETFHTKMIHIITLIPIDTVHLANLLGPHDPFVSHKIYKVLFMFKSNTCFWKIICKARSTVRSTHVHVLNRETFIQ